MAVMRIRGILDLPTRNKTSGIRCVAEVRIGGALFFLFGNVPRGILLVPLEKISPFNFSSDICSRDESREQQLQIPSQKKQLLTSYLRIAGLSIGLRSDGVLCINLPTFLSDWFNFQWQDLHLGEWADLLPRYHV